MGHCLTESWLFSKHCKKVQIQTAWALVGLCFLKNHSILSVDVRFILVYLKESRGCRWKVYRSNTIDNNQRYTYSISMHFEGEQTPAFHLFISLCLKVDFVHPCLSKSTEIVKPSVLLSTLSVSSHVSGLPLNTYPLVMTQTWHAQYARGIHLLTCHELFSSPWQWWKLGSCSSRNDIVSLVTEGTLITSGKS